MGKGRERGVGDKEEERERRVGGAEKIKGPLGLLAAVSTGRACVLRGVSYQPME